MRSLAAKLNPFHNAPSGTDHVAPTADERISPALKKFLADEHKLSDAGIEALFEREIYRAPEEVKDKERSDSEYFYDSRRYTQLDEVKAIEVPAEDTDEIVKQSKGQVVRIHSTKPENLLPFYWSLGAQLVGLDKNNNIDTQINTAMFAGTEGYVLKPASLRDATATDLEDKKKQRKKKTRLILHIAGISNPSSPSDTRSSITATLLHPTAKAQEKTLKPRGKLEWTFTDDPHRLSFLLVSVKDTGCVAAIRLAYVPKPAEWYFLKLEGEVDCRVLVKVEVNEVFMPKTKAMPGWGW